MQQQIQMAKAGNQKAFYQIWNYYNQMVYSFVFKTTLNENLSTEITNSTFMKAFLRIKSYNANFEFSTWLFTIAKNTYIDYINQTKMDIVELSEVGKFHFYYNPLETESNDEEKLNFILEKLDSLKPQYREIIKLRLENYPYHQIAEERGVSISNVKVMINRAKRKLQESVVMYHYHHSA